MSGESHEQTRLSENTMPAQRTSIRHLQESFNAFMIENVATIERYGLTNLTKTYHARIEDVGHSSS